jgi:hypothetical protein
MNQRSAEQLGAHDIGWAARSTISGTEHHKKEHVVVSSQDMAVLSSGAHRQQRVAVLQLRLNIDLRDF